MNNKLITLLTVSISNFKISNNILRRGFFLVEAVISGVIGILVSSLLFQYTAFMIQLHSAQQKSIIHLERQEKAIISRNSYTKPHREKGSLFVSTRIESFPETTPPLFGFYQ
jgi:Tfp pilus assembly protein PilE